MATQVSRRGRLLRRREIPDAARAVFAQKGCNAATLDDVAERAELGKGTFYNCFSTLLIVPMMHPSADSMSRWITAMAQAGRSGIEPCVRWYGREWAYSREAR